MDQDRGDVQRLVGEHEAGGEVLASPDFFCNKPCWDGPYPCDLAVGHEGVCTCLVLSRWEVAS